jgi:DNA polymerase-3 subunit alpha
VPTFTHLQVHSHFSLLGGTAAPADLVQRAAAAGFSHLALTDTNALYGAVVFAKACRAAAIQPIIGITVNVAAPAQESSLDRSAAPGRLLLLATGPAGYRSLCRLSTVLQGQPTRETIVAQGVTWETLQQCSDGLLCLSSGRQGWIERYLRAGHPEAAGRYATRLQQLYGDRAYLALELHQPADEPIAAELVALGNRVGLPLVAVQPVYCLEPAERPRLRLLAAMDHNCPLDAVPPAALPASGDPTATLHWLSLADIQQRFAPFPQAVTAVSELVGRCQPALPDGRPVWPAIRPAGLAPEETAEAAIEKQAQAGLTARYGQDVPTSIQQRLQRELAVILHNGYASLFLVIADLVAYARQTDVPLSTRGSVANSLAAYCLGITTVDPIAHDLLFERFLNPARANPPDIDLDFCSRRRDEILDYVRRLYGADRVALVATISTLQLRSAVRETAKAYGLDEAAINRLVRLVPSRWHPDPRRRDQQTIDQVIAQIEEPRLQEVLRTAYALLGQPHHLSVHPGGLVITPGPLTDYVPVQWAPKGFLITQFDHHDAERIGLPKLDLLGIRALTVLADTAELVQQNHDPAFRLADIPPDDPLTGDLLTNAETIGVFQCESAGAQRTLRQLQARTVADLAVANAFFKPGPAMGGMARSFVRRYRGQEPTAYLHPALEPILRSTHGVLLFQEQILRLATEIAGLNWSQADHLRRGMSKFQAAEMAGMQVQFVAGCCRPQPDGPAFSREQAQTLWEQVMAFAGYGLNRGHATAYGDVSYRSAYLRAHWPAEFLCARLADWGGFHHPAIYLAEATRLGIAVRPPHVNHSRDSFTLTYEPDQPQPRPTLWMGLGQVRDLRRDAIQRLLAERHHRPFTSPDDLLRRVPLQTKEMQHLIQCGALDGLGNSRAALLARASQVRQSGSSSQMAFAFAEPETPAESAAERLAWERHILGWPVSLHPLQLLAGRLPPTIPLRRLAESRGKTVTVAGARLPGWTGGPGFFLSDGDTFIIARTAQTKKAPPPWQPLLSRGRWLTDEWGMAWLQLEQIEQLT